VAVRVVVVGLARALANLGQREVHAERRLLVQELGLELADLLAQRARAQREAADDAQPARVGHGRGQLAVRHAVLFRPVPSTRQSRPRARRRTRRGRRTMPAAVVAQAARRGGVIVSCHRAAARPTVHRSRPRARASARALELRARRRPRSGPRAPSLTLHAAPPRPNPPTPPSAHTAADRSAAAGPTMTRVSSSLRGRSPPRGRGRRPPSPPGLPPHSPAGSACADGGAP